MYTRDDGQHNKLTDLFVYPIQKLIIYNRINVLCDGIKTPKPIYRRGCTA